MNIIYTHSKCMCVYVYSMYFVCVCVSCTHACACFCASVHEVLLKQGSTEEVSEAVHSEKYILGVEKEKFPQKQYFCVVCVMCSLNFTSNTYSLSQDMMKWLFCTLIHTAFRSCPGYEFQNEWWYQVWSWIIPDVELMIPGRQMVYSNHCYELTAKTTGTDQHGSQNRGAFGSS